MTPSSQYTPDQLAVLRNLFGAAPGDDPNAPPQDPAQMDQQLTSVIQNNPSLQPTGTPTPAPTSYASPNATDLTPYFTQLGLPDPSKAPNQATADAIHAKNLDTMATLAGMDRDGDGAVIPGHAGNHSKFLSFLGNMGKSVFQDFMYELAPGAANQRAEDARQNQLLQVQQFNRNNPTPYEQAQISQLQHSQATQDINTQLGLEGAGYTPGGSTGPGAIQFNGQTYAAPAGAKQFTIAANSDLGKHLGLPQDITMSQDDFVKHGIPLFAQFAADKDDASQKQATSDAIDSYLDTGKTAIENRFNNSQDPSAPALIGLHKQELAQAADDARKSGKMEPITKVLQGLKEQTPWEKSREKQSDLKAQLAIRAAEATGKGDTHLTGTIIGQSKAFDDLQKPIQSEWEQGNDILALAGQKTPAADAQLITAMMPYVTGVKRFNQAEIKNAAGGATAWTNLQRTLNKYSSDPFHAQIPDDQRAQLVSIMNQKQASLKGRLDKINSARDDVAGASNSAEVLTRSAKLHRDLSDEAPQAPTTIRVRRKSDGATGTLNPSDFDPAKYDRVQ
jgi:hypothetical protein